MAWKILIADDEEGIVCLLQDYFEMQGYEVITARGGVEALEKVSKMPDIILLDINMPDLDGLEVCRKIREYVTCPIVFLTAKVEEQDRINGFLMGGDDYITKPFELDFVIAKVQALLRRSYEFITQTSIIEHEGLVLNLLEGIITYQNQSEELTKNELKIIQLLLENKGNIVSRDKMMVKLWNSDCYIDDNTLTVNVNRLRKKIEKLGLMNFVKTKKGMGYYV